MKIFLFFILSILQVYPLIAQVQSYTIRGEVIDKVTRKGVPYAAVIVEGDDYKGSAADSLGRFEIVGVRPGICRLAAFSLGYEDGLTQEYIIKVNTPPIIIELEPGNEEIESVVVSRSLFERVAQSPVSLRRIGLQQIEKSAGANRDLSKVVQSYPGVSFSPINNRNDLIVRGGSPSENRFYLDGIEIPNINHFATQGASGGPVSIINADLIREIDFYAGAFPASRSGALSSMLDVKLRDGNSESQDFKATLGASEVSLSGSGYFSKKTTYLFSIRQSYLQFLFKALGLPFLPNFIDGQVKIKSRLSSQDELTFLALTGVDKMSLNEEGTSATAEYILGYLPEINQETFTIGAKYRHYDGENVYSLIASHSYLNNRNVKYRNNDDSSSENLILDLRSIEQKSSLRSENKSYLSDWTIRYGAELSYSQYSMNSLSSLFAKSEDVYINKYSTNLDMWGWGLFVSGDYTSQNDRFTASIGSRLDGSDYSKKSRQFWRQFSPRAAVSYKILRDISLNASSGIYYQLPAFTTLGYRAEGELINRDLTYMRVSEVTLGADWRPQNGVYLSLEGFYKNYDNLLLSLANGIPLSDVGNDYGTVGNEAVAQSVDGRAYGAEIMARWQISGKLSSVASITLFRSEYRASRKAKFIPSAWDNRYIINMSGTYNLSRDWSVGAKLGIIGGQPYTPYDIELSSLVSAWDIAGRAYYDYSRYNTLRLPGYAQLDVRVDKNFYFKSWGIGIYVDIQNITASKLRSADIPIATGEVFDPSLPPAEQQYIMEYLINDSGVLLPTIGVTVEF